MTKIMNALKMCQKTAQRSKRNDAQMDSNHPRKGYRQSPMIRLYVRLELLDTSRVVRVNPRDGILEVGRVVDHV